MIFTLTVAKLREVVEYLKLRYEKQVPEPVFFQAVMDKIGASAEVRRNAAEAIHTRGFMQPLGNGIWEFTGEYAPVEPIGPAGALTAPEPHEPPAEPEPEEDEFKNRDEAEA